MILGEAGLAARRIAWRALPFSTLQIVGDARPHLAPNLLVDRKSLPFGQFGPGQAELFDCLSPLFPEDCCLLWSVFKTAVRKVIQSDDAIAEIPPLNTSRKVTSALPSSPSDLSAFQSIGVVEATRSRSCIAK